MRSIDIFDVANNMSDLMIKNDDDDDDDDEWLIIQIQICYMIVNYGDLTNKNIGRKQGFRLKESGQGNR